MSATLVIMAAGLASRYGGAKQIEKVGPGGEILMEYTIHDAQRAGFDRFVIILQPQMLEDFRAVCGERLEGKAHVVTPSRALTRCRIGSPFRKAARSLMAPSPPYSAERT